MVSTPAQPLVSCILAGQDFDELAAPRRVRKWWEAHESDFAPGVRHRLVPDLDPGVLDRARDWWRANSDRFVDGALYKYGHRVQPPDGS
jgi:hypothetical protein